MKKEILAVMVVLAIAFAGVTLIAEESDADAPKIIAYNNASNLHAFLYSDDVIMLDTSQVPLGANENVYVRIAGPSTTESSNKVLIGPLPAKERIYVDASGKDLGGTNPLVGDTGTTTVELLGYNASTPIGAAVTLNKTSDTKTFTLDPNYSKGGVAVEKITLNASELVRSKNQNMSTTLNASLVRTSISLIGWASSANATTIDIKPMDAVNMEDLFIAANTEFGTLTTTTLYAVWGVSGYNITIEPDVKKDNGTVATASGSNFIIKDAAGQPGYGILQISQTTAGSYKYTVEIKATATGAVDSTPKATQLANGLYRISNVDQDITIKVTAADWNADESGFDLTIDSITNDANKGTINVSLDIFDYKRDANDKLSVSGTYYKKMDGSYRVYGNIANLDVASGSPEATWSAFANGETVSSGLTKQGVLTLDTEKTQFDLIFTGADGIYVYGANATLDATEDFTTPWAIYQI